MYLDDDNFDSAVDHAAIADDADDDAYSTTGIWWSSAKDYKNAITNELFLMASVTLHRSV